MTVFLWHRLNDMLGICSCPCEIVGFTKEELRSDRMMVRVDFFSNLFNIIFGKDIINHLTERDGSGVWVQAIFRFDLRKCQKW